jgi:transglutaminase-like putative cysteine protease
MLFGRAEPPTISVIVISVTPQSEAWMFNIGIPLIGVLLITIGLGVAADVPFVFDETSVDVASYTSVQLEQARTSSPELSGVPSVSTPSDNEVIAFPITGGGSTPEGEMEKNVGELKKAYDARVEPENKRVNMEAVVLAAGYPGERTIDQISSIYSYLKNGWSYVADTRGIDNFRYANETLEIGKYAGCVGAGDCDDFAILMSALIESIGGTTRIILARNSSIGGHAYTEVYLGNLDAQNNQVEVIIDWLKQKFNTGEIYTHIHRSSVKDI